MYKDFYPTGLCIGQKLATVSVIRIQYFETDIDDLNKDTSILIIGNLYVDVNSFDFQTFGCVSITAQLEKYIDAQLGVKSQIEWSEIGMQNSADNCYDLYITLKTSDLRNLASTFTM